MKQKLNIILVGSAGRVGQEIVGLLATSNVAQIYAKVDHKGRGDFKTLNEVKLKGECVIVDFSSRTNFQSTLQWAAKNKIAVVSGTTGLEPKDLKAIKRAAQSTAVLWSSNTSPGINLFLDFIEAFGARLAEYDLALEESHHSAKKDAPSGTAKTIQSVLSAATKMKLPKPVSIRGGGIFGQHKLWIMGAEEVITFEHTALNRRVFARGAVLAALWLAKRKPGVYSMKDVLRK